MNRKTGFLTMIGPGILVAATGVGAGDLATGAFTGSKLGVAILWVVLLGAGLKFLVNEGLARWQLATGTTLLEGCSLHLGKPVQWIFLFYLLFWSFFVGSALMSACGATFHAILPLLDARSDKILYGILHSMLAVLLVRLGGFQLFEKVMGVCIGVMFVVVITTAVALKPSWPQVGLGLLLPTIPHLHSDGVQWTVALMGGVGGTLTVLCYGYWIREQGRQGIEDLRACRIDLGIAYTMTALFGIAMVIIGSTIQIEGGGAGLIVNLADKLELTLGAVGKWAFLAGAWGAIFSSMLGVWQSVPYLFADFYNLMTDSQMSNAGRIESKSAIDTSSKPYLIYLFAIATIPAIGLWTTFETAQKVYAIVGAAFIPLLATVLLILNGQARLVGRQYRNSLPVSLLLAGVLVFFLLAGGFEIRSKLF